MAGRRARTGYAYERPPRGRPSPSEQEANGAGPESDKNTWQTATTQVKILVPGSQSMVALLGQRDDFLKLIESAFDADVLVRGNEITITGRPRRGRAGRRCCSRSCSRCSSRGHELTDAIGGADHRHGQGARRPGGGRARPSEVLGDRLLTAGARSIAPKTLGQKRYVDAIRRSTVTFAIGPAGTGKTYLAVADGGAGAPGTPGLADHPHPAGGRGGGAARVPARHALREDRSVPEPLYDALYDMMDAEALPRLMERGHDRGRAAGVHARPHAERLVHHPGRGAEHHARADEDVPDPARVRLEGRRHRRRHPDRPAERASDPASSSWRRSSTGIEGIEFVHLGARDVVRHKIVQDIVEAYGRLRSAATARSTTVDAT